MGIINIFVHRKDLPPYLLDFFQIFYGVAGLIIGIYALRIRYTADNFIDEKDKEIKAIEEEEEKASEKISYRRQQRRTILSQEFERSLYAIYPTNGKRETIS